MGEYEKTFCVFLVGKIPPAIEGYEVCIGKKVQEWGRKCIVIFSLGVL